MNKEAQRQQVIQALVAQQRHIATVAKQEMDSAQQQSNDYGANVDRYDSYRTKMMRQRDMYARQLSNANASLRILGDLLRQAPMTRAEHGAIVVTNRQRFFLSIGAGKFQVPFQQGPAATSAGPTPETYFAISAGVPVFMAMKGLREGESFTFNGVTQTILEIF